MLVKTLERSGIFGSKILTKNSKQWGIYSPQSKTSRWDCLSVLAAGGRPAGRPPTVIFMTVGKSRSTAQNQRAKLSGRSTARSTVPWTWPTCTSLCTSVDRPGRPTLGPVDRPGRPPEPDRRQSGSKNWVLNNSNKSHKTSKNPQK